MGMGASLRLCLAPSLGSQSAIYPSCVGLLEFELSTPQGAQITRQDLPSFTHLRKANFFGLFKEIPDFCKTRFKEYSWKHAENCEF
jgi:hypothetical protein